MDDNIWNGSGWMDYYTDIIELCGLDLDEYFDGKSALTKEILEKYLDMLI